MLQCWWLSQKCTFQGLLLGAKNAFSPGIQSMFEMIGWCCRSKLNSHFFWKGGRGKQANFFNREWNAERAAITIPCHLIYDTLSCSCLELREIICLSACPHPQPTFRGVFKLLGRQVLFRKSDIKTAARPKTLKMASHFLLMVGTFCIAVSIAKKLRHLTHSKSGLCVSIYNITWLFEERVSDCSNFAQYGEKYTQTETSSSTFFTIEALFFSQADILEWFSFN